MKELSRKLLDVPKSGIRKLFDILSQKQDTISFGIGQPDFPTPQEVVNATIKALEEGKGAVYAPTRGVPRLQELIAERLRRENKMDVDPAKNILITPGGSGAIALAFSALLNPGDELLMFSPNFVSYFYVSRFFGGSPVEVPRNDDLSTDIDAMKKMVSEKTKAILINSPNNPTGYTCTPAQIEEIASICVEHDLYLISDEVYDQYLFDGRKHVSPASLNGMSNRTITLNAASKIFSVTGFRVGYLCAPEAITPLMENFLQYTSAGVNHPAQYGTIAGLELALKKPDFLKNTIASYQERRDICHARLNEMGLPCPKPGGAFYVMPDVSPTGLDGTHFSEKLVENQGVAVVPGSTFGKFSTDRVRISYALDETRLIEGLDRMEQFVKSL